LNVKGLKDNYPFGYTYLHLFFYSAQESKCLLAMQKINSHKMITIAAIADEYDDTSLNGSVLV
jgi:hypothetical protein